MTSNRSITMLVLVAVMAAGALTTTTEQRMLQQTSGVSWNSERLGEILGAFWKMSILICLVLMMYDVFSRFGGKRIGVMHSVRFIWFIYGTATVYRVGNTIANSYRGFNDDIQGKFMEETYDGYFGSHQFKIFKNPMTVSGTSQDSDSTRYQFMQNALFIELIIFLIFRFANLATLSGIAPGNPVSHLIGSLRRVIGFFLALFNTWWGLNWYKYMRQVGKLSGIDDRNKFNVWLSYILAFYVHIEAIICLVEVFVAAVGTTKTSQSSLAGAAQAIGGANQSYPAVVEEVAFMHQHKTVALAKSGQHYNALWMVRWTIVIVLSIIWENKPRTMLGLFVLLDAAFIIYPVMIMGTFGKRSGCLILASEIFTFLRHLVQLFNFMDLAADDHLKQFMIDLFTHVAFWSYIISTIIEFVLLFLPACFGGLDTNDADVRLDLESNNELGTMINNYKSMKSGKPAQGYTNPGQNPGQLAFQPTPAQKGSGY